MKIALGKGLFTSIKWDLCLTKGHLGNPEGQVEVFHTWRGRKSSFLRPNTNITANNISTLKVTILQFLQINFSMNKKMRSLLHLTMKE